MAVSYMSFRRDTVVVIPVIQRDYVQGADRNREKREEFLTVLMRSLESGAARVNLDFIYGIVRGARGQSQGAVAEFLPVDGQQRLTTLYLLAWLLAQRGFEPGKRPELPRLDYRTRPATQQFVEELRRYNLPDTLDWGGPEALSAHLKRVPDWFADAWMDDPSVMAMLQMLDAMNRRLNSARVPIQEMAQRFFGYNPVQLEVLDMKAYALDEDLYIKMNARGKPLTKFENWKAEFGKFLKKQYPFTQAENEYDKDHSIPEYFDYAIEHHWCDLFWHWALKSWESPSQQAKATFPRIDEFFMSFFDRLTELLFYAQRKVVEEEKRYTALFGQSRQIRLEKTQLFPGPDGSWERANSFRVYKKKENVLFLFNVLDLFSKLESKPRGIKAFFEALLCASPAKNAPDKVNITYGSETKDASVNLFEAIIAPGKGPARNELLLFYGICKRLLKYGDGNTQQLSDFIRVFWGWILGIWQRDKAQLAIVSDLRVETLWYADQILDALLDNLDVFVALNTKAKRLTLPHQAARALRAEITKATWRYHGKYDAIKRLFQLPDLRGDLHHLYPALAQLSATECVRRFREFYAKPPDERVEDLCRHGFNGIEIWRDRRYYGAKDGWQLIFVDDDCTVTDALTGLLLRASPNPGPKDEMRWYMSHYPSFRTSSVASFFYVEAPFTVWTLRKGAGRRKGFAHCPYAYTVVARLVPATTQCLGVEESAENSSHGRVWLNAVGYTLECVADGWYIECVDPEKAREGPLRVRLALSGCGRASLQNAYTFKDSVLQDLPDKDRVETAVAFLEDIARLYKAMTSFALRLPPAVSLPRLPPALLLAFPLLS